MAYTSVTYTFTNATVADATQVNQNFTDLINGLSDGTKDISCNAFTAAGAATLNGNVTLGNASGDDITFTGSLAATLPIKTTNTYDIGAATKGLAGIYLGANSQTVRLIGSASMSATWTLTLPVTAGTSGSNFALTTNGSGVASWTRVQPCGVLDITTDIDYVVTDTDGYGTIIVTHASACTITLPTAADNTGRILTVKKANSPSYTVTVDGEGAEVIDTATTKVLTAQYSSICVQCNGTGWNVLYSDFTPEVLENSIATAMGLKQYRIGTAYNGGNTPAIAITVGTLNQSEGLLIPYQVQDGSWRLKFNFDISTTGTFAFNSITVGLSGITTGNTGVLNYIAISLASGSGGCYGSAAMYKNTTSTNNLIFITGVATVAGTWLFSGDVSLASKPTWAY